MFIPYQENQISINQYSTWRRRINIVSIQGVQQYFGHFFIYFSAPLKLQKCPNLNPRSKFDKVMVLRVLMASDNLNKQTKTDFNYTKQ